MSDDADYGICPECGGSGWANSEDPEDHCPACMGRGYMHASDVAAMREPHDVDDCEWALDGCAECAEAARRADEYAREAAE